MRKTRLIAAAALATAAFAGSSTAAQAACGLTDCQQVTGTVASALSVTASTPVALSNTGVPGQLSLGASAAPATGQGTVDVVSTTGYCISVADTGNDGLLTNQLGAAFGQFTNRLQWSSATSGVDASAGTPAALRNTTSALHTNAANTLLKTYTINYSLALAGQNVPAGVYATTAQFSAQAC